MRITSLNNEDGLLLFHHFRSFDRIHRYWKCRLSSQDQCFHHLLYTNSSRIIRTDRSVGVRERSNRSSSRDALWTSSTSSLSLLCVASSRSISPFCPWPSIFFLALSSLVCCVCDLVLRIDGEERTERWTTTTTEILDWSFWYSTRTLYQSAYLNWLHLSVNGSMINEKGQPATSAQHWSVRVV